MLRMDERTGVGLEGSVCAVLYIFTTGFMITKLIDYGKLDS